MQLIHPRINMGGPRACDLRHEGIHRRILCLGFFRNLEPRRKAHCLRLHTPNITESLVQTWILRGQISNIILKEQMAFFFFFLMAAPTVHGRSWARGHIWEWNWSCSCWPTSQPQQHRIQAVSATYTPQLRAMPDPSPTEWSQGSNPLPHGQ